MLKQKMLMPAYTTCNCSGPIPWASSIHATLLVVIEDMNYKWEVISLFPPLKVTHNDHHHCLTFIITYSHLFASPLLSFYFFVFSFSHVFYSHSNKLYILSALQNIAIAVQFSCPCFLFFTSFALLSIFELYSFYLFSLFSFHNSVLQT